MIIDYTKREARFVKASKPLVDAILSVNKNNRKARKSHITWIKKAIEEGKFVLTGQAISLSKDGELIDGQHRLLAIRDSGYPPVELLLVTGLEKEAKIYVDQHAKRSVADMLKIVLDKTVNNKMASIVTTSLKVKDGSEGFILTTERQPLEAVMKEMKEYAYWLSLIVMAGGQHMRAGVATAIFHYAKRFDIDLAIELAESAKNGERLVKTDPAYKLRQLMLLAGKGRAGGSAQIIDYKNTVTCCVAHARGDKIENLRASNTWDKLPKKKDKVFLKGDAGKQSRD